MPKRKATESQVTGYDVTFPCDRFTEEDVRNIMYDYATKWVFQKEKGKTGYEHFQCRMRLRQKRRLSTLLAEGTFKGGNLSITSSDVHLNNNFNYVMKDDTRIGGPWKDTDVPKPPKTRQLTTFLKHEMYPWQKDCLKIVETEEDRNITLIRCPHGNNGKSIFAEFLEYLQQAYEIPAMRSMEDIMQCVCSIGKQKCFVIDMPRGMKKTKLGEFYSGIEMLKNGVAYDKRYHFKKIRFDRPQILVFTNSWPDFKLVSPDRWQLYEIDSCKNLKPMSLSALAGSL